MRAKKQVIVTLLLCAALLATVASGVWFWYDNNVDRSGWAEKDGVRYYRDFHAHPVTGWLELADGRYYFQEGGIPVTGWQDLEGQRYYFDDSGAMATGWLELDEETYYFGDDGVMADGWLEYGDFTCYFQDGVMTTGWLELEGARYHFSENGFMSVGLTEVDGQYYYFGDDGLPQSGLIAVDEKYYLFGDDGAQYTGWSEDDGGRRYFLPEGPMAVGWAQIDEKLYYFSGDGLMQTGWLQLGEYSYYLQEDGSAAVGPTVVDGATHYFTPKGIEVILVNALNPVPEYYQRELVNVTGYHDVDQRCYDALMQMLEDCNAAGIEYEFNSAYRTIEEQSLILECRTLEHMQTYELTYEQAREKALETVAVPGTSEHHLGLAVDLLGDDAIAWFREHCWDYGFIVRYSEEKEGITGIVDEPWHFRYVGTEVSLELKDSDLCLEEYLGAEAVTWEKTQELYGDWLYEQMAEVAQTDSAA